jgi:hypothetical protein
LTFPLTPLSTPDHPSRTVLTADAQIITATGTRFLVYADLRCLNCHQVRLVAAFFIVVSTVSTTPASAVCIGVRSYVALVIMNMLSGIFSIRQGDKR